MNQSKLMTYAIFGFFLLMILMTFANSTFITVNPGERAVLFERFGDGLIKDDIYTPGFHIVAPWNEMYVYQVREQTLEEEMEVLSRNGLDLKVDVTVRLNPKYDKIGDLHEKFGRDYMVTLVRAETRSAVREVIGRFEPEELYSSKRDEVQNLIQEKLFESLDRNYIELKATLIRDIELPEKVKNAIEVKIEAEQKALKYKYIIQQEEQEAQRKVIEARAKAEANNIISKSLTENILMDKGIDATLELANSPNTKIIIVGGTESGGLPMILGSGN